VTSASLVVGPEEAGERLDRWLARRLGLPARRCAALCEAGLVRIRGKRCSPLRRLYGGEAVAVERPAPARPAAGRAAAVQPHLTVLHDDAACLVVDKPADLSVEPAGPSSPSAVGAAAALGGFDVAGRAEPGLPHRLDRDTTGCLLLARTDAALLALQAAFQAGQVEKRYLALVRGAPPDEGRCDTPYGRDPVDPRRFTTRVASHRRARLSFRVLRRLRGAALLEVALETGRTHQIRVQLAEAGWPVLGDATYGEPQPGLDRQALHAVRLAFPSPVSGQVVVEAPLPPDLAAALAALT
jgi:23S rRNA pseudouridine1911/1915/1917 synthase